MDRMRAVTPYRSEIMENHLYEFIWSLEVSPSTIIYDLISDEAISPKGKIINND